MELTYHPIGDSYHCAFRSLVLLRASEGQTHHIETFRILDFYYLFPFFLRSFSKPRPEVEQAYHKLEISKIQAPYQRLPNKKFLFRQAEGVQIQALRHLVGVGLLEADRFRESKIVFCPRPLSQNLEAALYDEVKRQRKLLEFLTQYLSQVPLYGARGLKDRSGLMEYRYDPV